jgi:hypothetical protein
MARSMARCPLAGPEDMGAVRRRAACFADYLQRSNAGKMRRRPYFERYLRFLTIYI